MTTTQLLQEIVRRIRRVSDPEKIILFGSRAKGTANDSSDYDFLVIGKSGKSRSRCSAPLYTALATLPVEVDLMVYSPEEIKEWSNVR